jgi:hypothetical protein
MTKGKTSKQISCKVRMLDDQELPFNVDVSTRSISQISVVFYVSLRQALSIMVNNCMLSLSK